VIDGTGIGRPVVDMIRQALPDHHRAGYVKAATITGGNACSFDEASTYWAVPKSDLVSTFHVLFGQKRLRIARELTLAETLHREIDGFVIKTKPSGAETFSAWREKEHDDLILSLALALFFARRTPRPWDYQAPSQLTPMRGEDWPNRQGALGHGAEEFLEW